MRYGAPETPAARSPGILEEHKMITITLDFTKDVRIVVAHARQSSTVVLPRNTISEEFVDTNRILSATRDALADVGIIADDLRMNDLYHDLLSEEEFAHGLHREIAISEHYFDE